MFVFLFPLCLSLPLSILFSYFVHWLGTADLREQTCKRTSFAKEWIWFARRLIWIWSAQSGDPVQDPVLSFASTIRQCTTTRRTQVHFSRRCIIPARRNVIVDADEIATRSIRATLSQIKKWRRVNVRMAGIRDKARKRRLPVLLQRQ